MSTRQIRGHWRDARQTEDEKCPSRATMSLWAKRHLTMISGYIARLAPGVSDMWSTGELYVLVEKAMRCLHALMCRDTRRILGAGLEGTRRTAVIAPIAEAAKKAAGKVPEVELGDGAPDLKLAIEAAHKEAADGKEKTTQQAYAHTKGSLTNRRHGRVDRTLAERFRVPRSIKKPDGKPVAGFVAFHNRIGRHTTPGGNTPAAAAGIITKGANPWSALIKSAYWQAG